MRDHRKEELSRLDIERAGAAGHTGVLSGGFTMGGAMATRCCSLPERWK